MDIQYVAMALAALTAFLAILDSRLFDPYFAFYELVPGMGFADVALRGDRKSRAAVLRRFGYGFLLGMLLGVAGAEDSSESIAAGVAVSVLLLWPMLIHGVPRGKLRSDWLLVFVYAAVGAIYVSAAVAGQAFFILVAERDLVTWARDQALELIFVAVVVALAYGFLNLGLRDSDR
jgi:hypothetical protein